jgi:hypothetical protein
MAPVSIHVVVLGNLKHAIDFQHIENWDSEVLSLKYADKIEALPDSDGEDWEYTDQQLSGLIAHDPQYDLTLAIINAKLEDNYYMRRLSDNIVVLSLYETSEILQYEHIAIEAFVIRNLYEIVCGYLMCSRTLPSSVYKLPHDETRGCLFDLCANKADIVYSTSRPILCEQCQAALMRAQLDKNFIGKLQVELKKIKRKLFYRMKDFVEKHPVVAICIAALSSLLLNVVANAVYDGLKRLCG